MEEAGQTSGFLNLSVSAVRFRTNILLTGKKMYGKLQSILMAGIIAATGMLVQDANAFTRTGAKIDEANSDIVKVAEIPLLGSGKTDYASARRVALERLDLEIAA